MAMASRQRGYVDNAPIFLPLEPAVNLDLFVRQHERLEELMGPGLASYFQYGAGELPKTILNSEPRSEALAVSRIGQRLGMSVEEVVAWISISPAEREAIEVFAGTSAATEACDYRQKVLAEFLNLVRKKERKQNASRNSCTDKRRGRRQSPMRLRGSENLLRDDVHVSICQSR